VTTLAEISRHIFDRLRTEVLSVLKQTLDLGWTLLKIMVPVLILTKILLDLGVVHWIGRLLSPLMGLVGLPGSMGLVWAAGMLVSPYMAIMMYATLAPEAPLTIAQVTVLGSMILTAHALLLEIRLVQKAGIRMGMQLLLRIGGALVFGWLLNTIYAASGWLQEPSTFLFAELSTQESGWLPWAWEQVQSLALIFAIILVLMAAMRILELIGVIDLLKRLLSPLLNLLGMGKEAAPITMIGITLGIVLGGGLVIKEAQSGKMSSREVFFSLSLMCVFHSLIEDTAVIMVMGANLSGLLWIRMVYVLLLMFLLGKAINRLPQKFFDRFLYRAPE
jgi:hypothetical protein